MSEAPRSNTTPVPPYEGDLPDLPEYDRVKSPLPIRVGDAYNEDFFGKQLSLEAEAGEVIVCAVTHPLSGSIANRDYNARLLTPLQDPDRPDRLSRSQVDAVIAAKEARQAVFANRNIPQHLFVDWELWEDIQSDPLQLRHIANELPLESVYPLDPGITHYFGPRYMGRNAMLLLDSEGQVSSALVDGPGGSTPDILTSGIHLRRVSDAILYFARRKVQFWDTKDREQEPLFVDRDQAKSLIDSIKTGQFEPSDLDV